MCLLTYFPPGAAVNTERLDCGARCNPHGHGFAIVTVGGEVIVKHAMTPGNLIREFAELREQHPDSHALFHSRITTHGSTNLANCHPFTVVGPRGGQTILAHNGILPSDCQPKGKDSRSDTRILAERVLWARWSKHKLPSLGASKPRFTKQWLDSPYVRASIEKWLGTGSKVLVLTTNPRLANTAYLFNEGLGDWVDGVWYSNSSYETWKPSKYRSGGTWGGGSWGGSSYVYRDGGYVRIGESSWWDEFDASYERASEPTVVIGTPNRALDTVKLPSQIRINGTVWSGRTWNPHQSYLHHFRGRKCDLCAAELVARKDYICDGCGICWICFEYFDDCRETSACGSTASVRATFDQEIGYASKDRELEEVIEGLKRDGTIKAIGGVIKSAADSAAVFIDAVEGEVL